MPRGSEQYARSLAELTQQAGAIRAQDAQRRGELWGSAVSNIGPQVLGMLTGYRQRKQVEQDRTMAMEDRATAAQDREESRGWQAEMRERARLGWEREDTAVEQSAQQAKIQRTAQALASALQSPESYEAALGLLTEEGIDTSAFPKTFDRGWVVSRVKSAQSIDKLLEETKPPADYTLGPGGQRRSGTTNELVAEAPRAESSAPSIGSFEDYVRQRFGPRPTPPQIETARRAYQQADDRAGGGAPYYMPVQTAHGVVPFDARTGQFKDADRRDLKPGETAQREIANAQTTATLLRQVLTSVNDAALGPIAGRYKTVEAALVGNDPTFAAFAAAVSTLQNTVINLRTGAQMSEPEAQRILGELPTVKLPPATFIARAKQSQKYFEEWRKNRATVAYGRTTTGDVDRMVAPGQTAPGGAQADPLGIR